MFDLGYYLAAGTLILAFETGWGMVQFIWKWKLAHR